MEGRLGGAIVVGVVVLLDVDIGPFWFSELAVVGNGVVVSSLPLLSVVTEVEELPLHVPT